MYIRLFSCLHKYSLYYEKSYIRYCSKFLVDNLIEFTKLPKRLSCILHTHLLRVNSRPAPRNNKPANSQVEPSDQQPYSSLPKILYQLKLAEHRSSSSSSAVATFLVHLLRPSLIGSIIAFSIWGLFGPPRSIIW